jgi:hypothetical protein|tara:strand:- start:3 stop:710 length:708 start_codon:yes stop_codon:yes gene_type:complete
MAQTEAILDNLNFEINSSVQIGDDLYCSPVNQQLGGGNFVVSTTPQIIGEITEIKIGGTQTVVVTGIEHSAGPAENGRYCFFELEQMNSLLGGNYNNSTVHTIKHFRNNNEIYSGQIRVWNQDSVNSGTASPSGGSTKGHARYEPYSSSSTTDFKVGDVIDIDTFIGFNHSIKGLTLAQVSAIFNQSNFITFKKDSSVNSVGLKGYYALGEFINNDYNNRNELFTVGSEISISSK